MTSAQIIVLAEIEDTKPISGARMVENPLNPAGPQASAIPLHLARIVAKSLLTLRGEHLHKFAFYAWIWASGSHSGPRLFHPTPGSYCILFLRCEYSYLHTIGDYLSYDLEIPSTWTSPFIAGWNASSQADIFERLAAVRLRAELNQRSAIECNYWSQDWWDLMGLTSPFFVASLMDEDCRRLENRFGRFGVCEAEGREFVGRCEAFRRAADADSEHLEDRSIAAELRRCEENGPYQIEWLRAKKWPLPHFDHGRDPTPERHRLAIRLYASATDPSFHSAACEAAATMPEAREIPKCAQNP